MSKHASEGDFAELALAVYVEELVAQKRVLYVGDSSNGAAERLARAARSVDVISPDARARGTRRGGRVRSRPWPGADEDVAWDVIVAPDLPAAGLADEDKLDEVVGWLADGGVLVAGTTDPDAAASRDEALSYEALFELLDGVFDAVRMVGQAPFAGWSVVDFAPASSEPEVTFDGSLLEGAGEQARRYVALCGDRDVVLDAYAVVQIPSSRRAAPPAEVAPPARADERVADLTERLREQQDALDAANVHAEGLERELEEAEQRASEAKRRHGFLEKKLAELDERLEEAAEETFDEEYARLETALWERGRELTMARAELTRRGTLVRDLIEELEEARRGGPIAPSASRSDEGPSSGGSSGSGSGSGSGGGRPSGGAEESRAGEDATLRMRDDEMRHAFQAQAKTAVERAVSAETEKAELAFRLDEVRGELAVAERRSQQQLEEMARLEAALRGTVRGLNARLAEVIELYQLTQARLALTEDDRRAAEARGQDLARQLAESREQLEMEIARAQMLAEAGRAATPAPSGQGEADRSSADPGAAERERDLVAQLQRCQAETAELSERHRQARVETDLAKGSLGQVEERVEGMRIGYQARIAELVDELDSIGGDAERALIQVGELKTRLEVAERSNAALRGELEGTRLRLEDREEAVRSLVAARDIDAREIAPSGVSSGNGASAPAEPASTTQAGPEPVEEAAEAERATQADAPALRRGVVIAGRVAIGAETAGTETAGTEIAEREAETVVGSSAEDIAAEATSADALATELAEARREAEALRERVKELSRGAPSSGGDVAELRAAVGSRDAMIGRLQTGLADASERRRDLERRLAECTERMNGQREADSGASAEELAEMTGRLERSESDHRGAMAALDDTRRILVRLSEELPTPGAEDELEAGPSDGAEARRLRERLGRLDAEAADREVLLRSLTAQLQERDDRLRALERLGDAGADDVDPGSLRARLLEMEERVARLTEELEHERDARRRLEDRA